jgi:cell division septal protein FtsQ
MSVKAPAEKNFRRAKVKPSKRRGGRARLSWKAARAIVGGALVLYAGYRAFDLLIGASIFQVHRIAVRGNVRLSAGEVQALVDGLRGSSILTANLPSYRRRLLESPWVEEVALRRVLPSTVEVFVSERRPVGLCRLGGQMYLVDRHGTIIDEFGPQYAEFDLPVIDGLVGAPSAAGPVIDAARAELAARLIDAVAPRAELAKRLSQIDVSDSHDAVVLLERDPALLHVGEERFLERLQAYTELAPALLERVKDIDYVDLRFDGRVYVRPGGRGSRPADAAPRPSRTARRF